MFHEAVPRSPIDIAIDAPSLAQFDHIYLGSIQSTVTVIRKNVGRAFVLKIAFYGPGQGYVSTLWMTRMRQMLADRIAVNIDDARHVSRRDDRLPDTFYVPRKMNRVSRVLRSAGFVSTSDAKFRSDWMLNTVASSGATLVFAHFLDAVTQFTDVWQQLKIPVVVHCHGYDVGWDFRHLVTGERMHAPEYKQTVQNLPDNIWFIANSTATERRLLEVGINPDKIFLKRFGVPVADSPKVNTTGEPDRVLFLGRLVDFKGPIETAEAFSQIAKKHPEAILQFAGGGHLLADLEQRIQQLGVANQIRCLGPVKPEIGQQLRRRSAIFTAHNQKGAVTGQEEAFGVSMLEAMGEGIPVVTGRSGGLTDFVVHQETGLLFEPGDIDAHAAMLDELLSSKEHRESLGATAWQSVRDSYQTQHELDDLNRIFDHASRIGSAPTLQSRSQKQCA
ncbi:MAG: glycosyltransferase family 4 protein [Pirellulaceae bacterium]